jgi:hypothetical protein|tara:strand:- start:2674 stop:4044 length:1371 start_codon:yes stop_codon:yes gene_type:complete
MLNLKFNTFKLPDHVINTAAQTANVGLWEATKTSAYQAWNFNPTSSLFRTFEYQEAYNFSDEVLPKEELNKQYADMGLFFEKDTRKGVVDYIVQRKKIEQARSAKLAKAPQNLASKAVYLGAGLVTSFTDPINIAASFIPVVREARFASLVARLGATRARLAKGAIEGFVGNTLVEPIVYGVAQREQADYTYQDTILNLTAGTLLGSGMHLGFGKIGDAIASVRGKDNIYQRLAKSHPHLKDDLFRHAVTKAANDEAVNVGEVVQNSRLNNDTLIEIDNTKAELKKSLVNSRKELNEEGVKLFGKIKDIKQKIAALEKLDPKRKLKYIGTLKKITELKKKLKDLEAKEKAVVEKIVNENKVASKVKSTELSRDDVGVNPNKTEPIIENKTVQAEELDAENLSLRAKDMEKQLNNEAASAEVAANTKAMESIDNKIKNKAKIRDGIKAAVNCIIRRS